MFWSGNYIAVRELKCLLKEENVSLTQVLEADDILQECKADNKALIQFLTRPDILAELITLITEEPPKNVELASQYRHANIASEVLTSNLSMLRDRLSMDAVQMNRLCDFVNKDPPLNPLLASYFSKTIEMLLERSPKQDWYLHHIVCLHVLDIFKSRRDFLPNLLRHISTSAISDTFKCFLHLGSPFNKIILEWLDEHQFLESLIQIICGTYDPEEIQTVPATTQTPDHTDHTVQNQHNDKLDSNHNAEEGDHTQSEVVNSNTKVADTNGETEPGAEAERAHSPEHADSAAVRAERVRGVAAANAAALLCDIAFDACSVDPFNNEWYAGRALAARLRGEEAVRRLLQGVFTSPPRARRPALLHACRLLLALLSAPARAADAAPDSAEAEGAAEHGAVERAIAPHLPLLHHALLRHNTDDEGCPEGVREGVREGAREGAGEGAGERVGAARVAVAALLARLALSEVDDVPTALISLGSAGVLVDMLFRFPHNNFLHAQVCALVRNARANRRFSHRYTAHLIEECNLLTRLMDAFEQNEDISQGAVRAGYMGHVVAALRALDAAPPVLSSALQQRWDAFREDKLRPLLQRHDTPLGGIYPCENMYEVGTTIQILMDNMADSLADGYDFNETAAGMDEGAEVCAPLAEPLDEPLDHHVAIDEHMDRAQQNAKNYFLDLVSQRSGFDDELWDDADPAPRALPHESPWEGAGGSAGGEEGWAQFSAFTEAAPAPEQPDPFAPAQPDPFWGASPAAAEPAERGVPSLQVGFEDDDKDALTILLAQKMLTAFHGMPAADYRLPAPAGEQGDAPALPAQGDAPAQEDAPAPAAPPAPPSDR